MWVINCQLWFTYISARQQVMNNNRYWLKKTLYVYGFVNEHIILATTFMGVPRKYQYSPLCFN